MMKAFLLLFFIIVACNAEYHNFVPPSFEAWNALQTKRKADLPELVELNSHLMQIANSQELRSIFSSVDEFESLTESLKVSTACKNSMKFAISKWNSTWTKNMADAIAKPPVSIQDGAIHWVGGFQQCMKNPPPKDYPGPGSAPRSHYCKLTIGKPTLSILAPGSFSIDIGLCVPKACNETDIYMVTKEVMDFINETRNNTLPDIMHYSMCSVPRNEMKLSNAAIAMIVICCIFGFAMLCGTVYDVAVHQRREKAAKSGMVINNPSFARDHANGGSSVRYENMPEEIDDAKPPVVAAVTQPPPLQVWEKLLMAFSVYTNAIKIIDAKQLPGRLSCLDGIRFLSMSWVILGHTYFFISAYVNNLAEFFPILQTFSYQAIMNATFSVDSFFVLSGLLTAYMFLKEAHKMGTIASVKFWILYFFHRYWRLTPPYLLFLGFYTALLRYMGSGPMWSQSQAMDEPVCNKYWWRNMLYINNFGGAENSCMGWAWYLANDMQFHYFVASIVLPLSFIFGKFGAVISSSVFILVGVISTGVVSSVNNVSASLSGDGFNLIYVKPWCRVGAYAVGLLTGFLIFEHQKGRFRIPRVVAAVCWILATGTNIAVLYGLYGVNHGDYVLSENISALYNAMSRVSWAIGLSWLIFACLSGYGGWINSFLSWPLFIPLSRLTYSAYLVHPVIMILIYGSGLQAYMVSEFSMVYFFFGNMFAAYLAAFVLTLTWESPLIGLERILLKK